MHELGSLWSKTKMKFNSFTLENSVFTMELPLWSCSSVYRTQRFSRACSSTEMNWFRSHDLFINVCNFHLKWKVFCFYQLGNIWLLIKTKKESGFFNLRASLSVQGAPFFTLNSACCKNREVKGVGTPPSQTNSVAMRLLWSFFLVSKLPVVPCSQMCSQLLRKPGEVKLTLKQAFRDRPAQLLSNSTDSSVNVSIWYIWPSIHGHLNLRIFTSDGASPWRLAAQRCCYLCAVKNRRDRLHGLDIS